MNSNPSPHDVLRRIKPIVDDVFDQADPLQEHGDYLKSNDDICPLYCAISQIKERYQNPELIGRGGMKEIYRVYDARAARQVAMAKPLPEFSSDQFDAFLREAHLTARLDHPNIINLFDMDVDLQGRPFFTMELKQGRSLREVVTLLRHGKGQEEFPERKLLEIFLRVCDAVAFAHSRRVLHLDIKPENIFVGEFGEVKLCDWGMGVVMPHPTGQCDSTVLLDPDLYGALLESAGGTPVYMAPEQKNKRQPKTPQMDVFALGCLLQELLTYEPNIASPKESENVDLALAAIISKAKATDPANRYQKVEALREDISRYLNGFSTSVERRSILREASLFYQRHREACSLTLGLLAILTLSVSFFVLQLSRSRQQALNAKEVAIEARAHAQEAQINAETAQQLTAKALTRAEQSQVLAEESLAKYMAEKEESDQRRYRQIYAAIRHSEFVIDSAIRLDDSLDAAIGLAIDHLDSILDFNPPPESYAWTQKFWVLFIIQDFETALDLKRNGKTISADLVQLAEKYSPYRNVDGYLDSQHLIEVMYDLVKTEGGRAVLAEKLMIYDMIHRRSPEEKLAITQAWVELNNPSWQSKDISYDPETETVRLRGQGLTHLQRTIGVSDRYPNRFSLLQILQPKVLDLRETQVSDLRELRFLDLLELDIRQTPVIDLSPLQANRTLRRVYIDRDQISKSDIESLPPSIEVVIEPE